MAVDWLNPNIFPVETDAGKEILSSTRPEICAEGGTRMGKTITDLIKVLGAHFEIPGLQTCITRANAVDLTPSVRADIRMLLKYDLDDPRSPVKYYGGATRFDTLYINEGVCRLGGMNRPSHILGTQYDICLLSQLEQFTEEQYQILKTRCSGSSNQWQSKDGTPLFQMLCDANPDIPDHWMYQRESEGKLHFVKFTFKDSPYLYRQGRWSKVGKTMVEELYSSLTGIYRDRYFHGRRVAPTGMVFPDLGEEHFIDTLPKDVKEYKIHRAMDFGSTSPSVCVWIWEHRETEDVIVAKEWRKTGGDMVQMATEVKYHDIGEIESTIIDNDEIIKNILTREGIHAILTTKSGDTIKVGIDLINEALRKTTEGKPGGLKFYTGLRCHEPDPELFSKKAPLSVIKEMRNLVYDEKKDKPADGQSDHAIDALRYWFLYWRVRGQVPFYGKSLGTKPKPSTWI